jgi:hypothetical protein
MAYVVVRELLVVVVVEPAGLGVPADSKLGEEGRGKVAVR